MKCPKCGRDLAEGKLLCEYCGEEVTMVPEFDIELEAEIHKNLSNMVEDMSLHEEEEYVEEFLEEDDDLKEHLRDYFLQDDKKNGKKGRILLPFFVIAVLAVGLILVVIPYTTQSIQENSYEYQYNKAIECATNDHYDEAVIFLERALALEPSNIDGRFLLAKYYDKSGQSQSAILVLEELLGLETERKEEIYDLLLKILENRQDYTKMGEVLRDCEIERIVSKYNKYASLEPIFNKEEGVYDELISITLKGNTEGFVYYTLDGSAPTKNSMVYESPILLESGDYIIKALFVNMYGIESDVATKTYYISLSVPDEPDISLESGSYDGPQMIEIYHADDTKIFYTMDGTTPTEKSLRYTEPLEMPFGVSNFAIVAINEAGVHSEVIKRTFQMSIQANFSSTLALQVLYNNLWANGTLLDLDGHVPNRLGVNEYHIQTVVNIDGRMYYIVHEEYIDTTGKTHETNNMYAIDTETADLYTARKISEGKYILKTLEE